eukprot:4194047-Prymnesium_polylepis.1
MAAWPRRSTSSAKWISNEYAVEESSLFVRELKIKRLAVRACRCRPSQRDPSARTQSFKIIDGSIKGGAQPCPHPPGTRAALDGRAGSRLARWPVSQGQGPTRHVPPFHPSPRLITLSPPHLQAAHPSQQYPLASTASRAGSSCSQRSRLP